MEKDSQELIMVEMELHDFVLKSGIVIGGDNTLKELLFPLDMREYIQT